MLIRKLFFIVLVLTVVLLTPLSAQDKETLAVLDFTTEAVSKIEMGAIVEFLSAELFNTDKYIVIDVSQRETILSEMEFSLSGCSDDTCALEIGKMLSAEMIVTGNLSKIGTRYLMSVKMLETETSRTVGTANGKFKDLDELIDGLEQIAYTLADMEKEAEATEAPAAASEPETVTEAEPEPEPAAETTAEEVVIPPAVDEGGSAQTVLDTDGEKKTGDFNWLAFTLSALGSGEYAANGIFSGLALTERVRSEDLYNDYMTAAVSEAASSLYNNYEDSYYSYKSKVSGVYITSGLAGGFYISSLFLGDSYISFGGKIASSVGTAASVAGNISMVMAMNSLMESRNLYEDYMSTVNSETASRLYSDLSEIYSRYQIQQYVSYGLLGAGGLLQIGAWFIPGEKEAATSGILQKIILGVGYLFMSGGNYTNQIAISNRFSAEQAYADYMAAGASDAASTLYENYDRYYGSYATMSYITYGLWGAGAAAVITALMLPDASAGKIAESDYNFNIRPSLTGFGVEVDISLR